MYGLTATFPPFRQGRTHVFKVLPGHKKKIGGRKELPAEARDIYDDLGHRATRGGVRRKKALPLGTSQPPALGKREDQEEDQAGVGGTGTRGSSW